MEPFQNKHLEAIKTIPALKGEAFSCKPKQQSNVVFEKERLKVRRPVKIYKPQQQLIRLQVGIEIPRASKLRPA
jgi:hypothetical protein